MKQLAKNLCALAALGIVGCGEVEDPDTLVIWHAYRDAEEAQLKEIVQHYEAKTKAAGNPQKVRVVGLPYDAFANKLSNAIPRGNGPDLFIFAHDRLGDWAETDLLEPISFWADEALADLYLDGTLEPLTYRGDLYGLPTSYKSLVLFYDKKLVSKAPETTDEMIAEAKAARARDKDAWGIAYEIDSLYSHAPWLHGFGGSIYKGETDELAIENANVANSMRFVRRLLVDEKIFPEEANSSLVTSLFNQHKLAFAVSGPWFISEIKHKDWAATVLPKVSETGLMAKPYMGVEGVFLSKRSNHKREAFELMKYLTGDEESFGRMDKAGQIVANRAAYKECNELTQIGEDREKVILTLKEGNLTAGKLDQAVGQVARSIQAQGQDKYKRCLARPELQVFQAQAAQTMPLSNRPHMNRVWTPMQRALSNVIVHGKDPMEILKSAVQQIQK